MAADDEVPGTSPAGLSTRDLVIMANTKLDGVGIELREIRKEQDELNRRVTILETDKAVAAGKVEHEGRFLSKRQGHWAVVYAIATLLAITFGNEVEHLLAAH